MTTPVAKLARKLFEKAFGTFSEGGDLPKRFGQLVELFGREARSQDDWAAFTRRLAESAWKDAYARGVEYAERLTEHRVSMQDPDAVAEQMRALDDWEVPGFAQGEHVPPGSVLEAPRVGDVASMNQAALDYQRSRMCTGPNRAR